MLSNWIALRDCMDGPARAVFADIQLMTQSRGCECSLSEIAPRLWQRTRSPALPDDVSKPPVETDIGTFQLTRHADRLEFVCGRCLQPKTTRNAVAWTTESGTVKTICNGCYGYLRAKGFQHD